MSVFNVKHRYDKTGFVIPPSPEDLEPLVADLHQKGLIPYNLRKFQGDWFSCKETAKAMKYLEKDQIVELFEAYIGGGILRRAYASICWIWGVQLFSDDVTNLEPLAEHLASVHAPKSPLRKDLQLRAEAILDQANKRKCEHIQQLWNKIGIGNQG